MSTSSYASTAKSSVTSSFFDVDPTTNASNSSNSTLPAAVFSHECVGLGATTWYLYLGGAFPVGVLANCLVLYTYWRLRAKRQTQESLDTLLMALAAADLVLIVNSPSWVSAPRGGLGCLAAAWLSGAANYASACLLLLVVCQSSFELLGPPHGSFARRLRARPLAAALFAATCSAALSVFTMLIAGAGGGNGGGGGAAEECLLCRPDPSHGRIGGRLFKIFFGFIAPVIAMSPFVTRAFREDSAPRHTGGGGGGEEEDEAARRRAERRRPYRAPFGITIAWAAAALLHAVSLLLCGPQLSAAGAIYSDLCLLALLARSCVAPLLSVTLRECYWESVLVFSSWATGPCRGITTSQAHNKVMQPIVEMADIKSDSFSLHSTIDVIESSATPRMDGVLAAKRRDGYLRGQDQVTEENCSMPRTPRITQRTLTV